MTFPADTDAERLVLGAILLTPDVCDDVALVLEPADFHDEAYGLLFRHIRDQYQSGRQLDAKLLADRLKADTSRRPNCWEFIGGAAALAKVMHDGVAPSHAASHAARVRDMAIRRQLMIAGGEIEQDARDVQQQDADALLERAQVRVCDIAERRVIAEPVAAKELMHEALAELDARMSGDARGGLPTGFEDLDDLLGGMRGGQVLIVAARPGMGKSSFAMNVAEHVALEQETGVLFASLEMGKLELAERSLASLSGVNHWRIRQGTISVDDRERLVEASGRLALAPLYVLDEPSLSVRRIASHCRRQKRKHGLGLVVVDYLQLVEPEDSRMPREQQVAAISRGFKAMAKQLDVPVMVLAQLNRQVEQGGGDKRPRLSNLRESGSIEQDADAVLFVHRAEYYDASEENKGLAEVIVAKQRNGCVGNVELVWRGEFLRFDSKAPERFAAFDEFNGEQREMAW